MLEGGTLLGAAQDKLNSGFTLISLRPLQLSCRIVLLVDVRAGAVVIGVN